MATVELLNVTKRYTNDSIAVDQLNLAIADGEFLVLVGPSGCGKTTALRMVAGLEDISEGEILIGGKTVNHLGPKDRDVAMVFQNYGLYPHMTVADNIGFALKVRRMKKQEIVRRVNAAAEILGLDQCLDRKPGQLSGGQRQRVAMGRAIVREPTVFLMDEPLSNLDAKLRVQMRAEVIRVHRRLGVATLYVTHDQVEAMTMGDRVAVIMDGILQQVGSPQEIFARPANVFVASFIGSPSMNLFRAALSEDGAGLRLGDQLISVDRRLAGERPSLGKYAGKEVIAGIRPEHLSLTTDRALSLSAHVELVEALGSELFLHFRNQALRGEARGSANNPPVGSDGSTGALGVARVSARCAVKTGEDVRLAIDGAEMHFFDPSTGVSL